MLDLSLTIVFQIATVFMRIAGAIAFMPLFGEKFVFNRYKIILSLLISIIIYPLVKETIPEFTNNLSLLLRCIFLEIITGITTGLATKLIFESLHVVGTIISMQSGLGAAMFFTITKEQTSIFTNLLSIIAIIILFATDTHHFLLKGLIDSYYRFRVNDTLLLQDLGNFITQLVNNSFILAFQISAPFIVVGTAIVIGAGFLSRLMPTLQVFFVLTPAQIMVTIITLVVVINYILEKLVITLQQVSQVINW